MNTAIISEKDEFTRLGLKSALEASEDISILGDYETDEMMLSDLSSLNPDVVILGSTDSVLDRCRTCQEVRTLCPSVKVLTLSEKQKDDDLYEIILSGASGDVLKSAGGAEMVRSVSVVACGGLTFESEALIRLLRRIPDQGRITSPAGIELLGERERTILALIAKGYSNTEIGKVVNLSKFTVRNNIGEIRSKLNVHTRAELSARAIRYEMADRVSEKQ